MFTKNDLKTGMFGVMSYGLGNFVIVGDKIIYQKGGFDSIHKLNEDMANGDWKVEKVYEACCSFNNLESNIRGISKTGILVYDRERDTKKPYNGKVVCIKNSVGNAYLYTVGKIYQFKDGILVCDDGDNITNVHDEPFCSFDEFASFSSSTWIEIKE